MRFHKGTRRLTGRVLIGLAGVAVALVAAWPSLASGRVAAGPGVTRYPFMIKTRLGALVNVTFCPQLSIVNG